MRKIDDVGYEGGLSLGSVESKIEIGERYRMGVDCRDQECQYQER